MVKKKGYRENVKFKVIGNYRYLVNKWDVVRVVCLVYLFFDFSKEVKREKERIVKK